MKYEYLRQYTEIEITSATNNYCGISTSVVPLCRHIAILQPYVYIIIQFKVCAGSMYIYIVAIHSVKVANKHSHNVCTHVYTGTYN